MAYVTAALYFCCPSCRSARDVKRLEPERRCGEWLSVALPESLPTTVLTGFLGSGKTTLLRRALASPAFADTAVIVNEIGEIAIDHHLVDYVEGAVLELPGGCLCCAVREDLARTLRDLFDRRDAGEIRA